MCTSNIIAGQRQVRLEFKSCTWWEKWFCSPQWSTKSNAAMDQAESRLPEKSQHKYKSLQTLLKNPLAQWLGLSPDWKFKNNWLWGRWVISCAQLLYKTLAEATVVYMGTLEWNCFLKGRGCTFLLPWDKNYIIYISNMTGKYGVSNIVGLWHFTFHKKFFNNKWKWNRKIPIPLICIHTLHTF